MQKRPASAMDGEMEADREKKRRRDNASEAPMQGTFPSPTITPGTRLPSFDF